MASGLCGVVAWLVLCAILAPSVSADDSDCLAYEDAFQKYNRYQECRNEFCCGSCRERYCCRFATLRLTEDKQLQCDLWTDVNSSSALSVSVAVSSVIIFLFIIITCCICPCCCLYKMCRKPQPVIATSTHTTVVTTSPQHYPQQPTAMPSQPHSYQSAQAQYSPYQPIPVQPGYGAQPMPPAPYQGQAYTPGPPPTYQEAIGPSYPPNPMPYSQAAFSPSQPPYPLQPPAQPGANAPPPTHADFLSQPAYNPNYVTP